MCCQQQRSDARERRERRLGAPVASVYLVSSIGTSAASCSHWLQMRVYPCGGDKVQWQMAVGLKEKKRWLERRAAWQEKQLAQALDSNK